MTALANANGILAHNAEAGPSNTSRPPRAPSPPGGGPAPLIQLRSKAPLPLFTCAHPIPPSSSSIGSTLKLSVLRLLTGEMTERSSTAPMTESESLKLMTLHGWRMEMIALELRQNVLIAPETRDKIGDGADEGMEGFELGDDAECALLEPDDEVLIRLKPAFHLPDLHLPKLPSNHVYALPKGALTRAGTLSSPPPYSQVNIKKPAEPSSHSSSVQGQPNVNYNARHRDYTRGYRSITVQSQGQQVQPNQYFGPTPAEARKVKSSSNPALTGPSRPLGLGMGVEPPAAQPAATAYRPPGMKSRRSSSNQKDPAQAQSTPTALAPPVALTTAKVAPSPPLPQLPEGARTGNSTPRSPAVLDAGVQSPTSRPATGERKPSASAATTLATTTTQQQSFGSGKAAGQDSMPLTALVIGPGVQGAVGRSSNALMGHAGPAAQGGSGDVGNAKAFAGFTAAGGEVRHRSKQRTTSHSSQDTKQKKELKNHVRSRSQQDLLSATPEGQVMGSEPGRADMTPAQAAVDAAQRRAAAAGRGAAGDSSTLTSSADTAAAQAASGPSASESPKQSPRREKVQLPQLPEVPPIANLAPFPVRGGGGGEESDLPAMPTPADSPSVSQQGAAAQNRGGSRTVSMSGEGSAQIPTQRQLMKRTQSSAAQSSATNGSGHDELATRPAHDRKFSSSTQSQGESSGAAAGGDKKKATSRFARLAAPGLGLGLAPPLARRQNSQGSSVPLGSPGASQETGIASDAAADVTEDGNTPADEASEPPSTDAPPRKVSKAEKRYAEFQKQVAAEVSKQAQAEQQRTAEKEARRREEEKKLRKREAAAKERKEKEKWEIWDEVRKRVGDER